MEKRKCIVQHFILHWIPNVSLKCTFPCFVIIYHGLMVVIIPFVIFILTVLLAICLHFYSLRIVISKSKWILFTYNIPCYAILPCCVGTGFVCWILMLFIIWWLFNEKAIAIVDLFEFLKSHLEHSVRLAYLYLLSSNRIILALSIARWLSPSDLVVLWWYA